MVQQHEERFAVPLLTGCQGRSQRPASTGQELPTLRLVRPSLDAALGLCFVPLQRVRDQDELLQEILRRYPQPLSGYTLAVLTAWDELFDYRVCRRGDLLLVSCVIPGRAHRDLLQPVGTFSSEAQRIILNGAARLEYALRVHGVSERFLKDAAHADFVRHFEVLEQREYDNYIYASTDLATLAGHKYSKKRNLLAQAARTYDFTVEPLSAATLGEAQQVLAQAIAEEELVSMPGTSTTAVPEERAARFALTHFCDLGLSGILVRIKGAAVAFALFERQSPDTVVVCFERALRRYKGLYQVVNRETAKILQTQGFSFINREEDMGDEGLRQAKLSYYPVRIEPSYMLEYRGVL